MAKKDPEQTATQTPAPALTTKTVKLSTAETQALQGIETQKAQLTQQQLAIVQSVLETREIDQKQVVGGIQFSTDYKAISFAFTEPSGF